MICRPDAARGGAAYLIEDHCCQVILFGAVGDKAPSDHEGWVDFAATLPDKSVHDLIQRCEPITPGERGSERTPCSTSFSFRTSSHGYIGHFTP